MKRGRKVMTVFVDKKGRFLDKKGKPLAEDRISPKASYFQKL